MLTPLIFRKEKSDDADIHNLPLFEAVTMEPDGNGGRKVKDVVIQIFKTGDVKGLPSDVVMLNNVPAYIRALESKVRILESKLNARQNAHAT